jgi:hypothetical protein
MRESFEGKLSGTLNKALTDNGINPNGGELGRITGVVLAAVQEEVELIVSDSKELDKFRAEAKKKADAKAAANKPVGATEVPQQNWRRRWQPPVASPSVLSLSTTGGQVGSTVTIKGSGFAAQQGQSAVTFNGKPATISSWGENVIVASVPAGATSGELAVTVNGVKSTGAPFVVLP